MKHYRVLLTRSYHVSIAAEDEEYALRLSEFYLGHCPDLSAAEHRQEHKFKISNIEMTWNDAIEAEEVNRNNIPGFLPLKGLWTSAGMTF